MYAGGHGVAGFQADASVHILQSLLWLVMVRPPDGDGLCGGDADQCLIIDGRTGKDPAYPGSGIMVRMIQTIGIGEGGMGHAKFLGGFVHHVHETIHTAAYMLCNGHGGVVAGTKQQPVEQGLQCQFLPCLQIHGGPLRPGGLTGYGHRIGEVSLSDGHQCGEVLRGAGNQHFGVGVVLVQNTAAVHVYQNRRCGRSADSHRLTRENTKQ